MLRTSFQKILSRRFTASAAPVVSSLNQSIATPLDTGTKKCSEIDYYSIFVGNISKSFGVAQLKEHFSSVGEVQKVKVVPSQSGFGFVVFAREDHAQQALKQLNGTEIDGKSLKVAPAKNSSRAVYVKNMLNARKEITKLCETIGPVAHVQMRIQDTFAFVKFEQSAHAQKALEQLNGKPFLGKKLIVALRTIKKTNEKGTSSTKSKNQLESTQQQEPVAALQKKKPATTKRVIKSTPEPKTDAEVEHEIKHCVFIGHLPGASSIISSDQLRKHFSAVGAVVAVQPSRFGVEFVFDKKEHAQGALQLDGSEFEGKVLRVSPIDSKPNAVYVSNLVLMSDELTKMCQSVGPVVKVRLSAKTNFAIVEFEQPEHAQKALELLSGKSFYGRKITVKPFIKPTPKPTTESA